MMKEDGTWMNQKIAEMAVTYVQENYTSSDSNKIDKSVGVVSEVVTTVMSTRTTMIWVYEVFNWDGQNQREGPNWQWYQTLRLTVQKLKH